MLKTFPSVLVMLSFFASAAGAQNYFSPSEGVRLATRLSLESQRLAASAKLAYGNSSVSREARISKNTESFQDRAAQFKSNVDRNRRQLTAARFRQMASSTLSDFNTLERNLRLVDNLDANVSQWYTTVALTIGEIRALSNSNDPSQPGDNSFAADSRRLSIELRAAANDFVLVARANPANNNNTARAIKEWEQFARDVSQFSQNVITQGDRLDRADLNQLWRNPQQQFQTAGRFLGGISGTQTVLNSYNILQSLVSQIEILIGGGSLTPPSSGVGRAKISNFQRTVISNSPLTYRLTGFISGGTDICELEVSLHNPNSLVARRRVTANSTFSVDVTKSGLAGRYQPVTLKVLDCPQRRVLVEFINSLP